MAIKIVSQSPNVPALPYTCTASQAYTAGSLMYRDTSAGELKEATASVGTTVNIEAISRRTFTSASTLPQLEAYPILGPATMVIADCTSNTAANQLNKVHAMTDARTVANTSTTISTTLGVFVAIATVGAASDKKMMGYFIKLGQVTA